MPKFKLLRYPLRIQSGPEGAELTILDHAILNELARPEFRLGVRATKLADSFQRPRPVASIQGVTSRLTRLVRLGLVVRAKDRQYSLSPILNATGNVVPLRDHVEYRGATPFDARERKYDRYWVDREMMMAVLQGSEKPPAA